MPLDIDRLSDAAVTATAVRRLSPLGTLRSVPRDAVVARAGEPVETLFLVRSGRFLHALPLAGADATVCTTAGVPVDESLCGALIGLADWRADGRHATTVHAAAAGEVIALDPAAVEAEACRDGTVGLLLIGLMSIALRRCIGATGAMRGSTATQRTAAYLLGLPVLGRGAGHEVRLPMPKKTLAAHLGVTQQSLSRVWRRLAADGVRVQGRRIVIADPARLAAVAEGET